MNKKHFNPEEISRQLALPIEDFAVAFEELKRKGFLFTFAKTPDEFSKKNYPVRLIGRPAVNPNSPSVVSFGPFAVERKQYENAKENIKNSDTFKTYLGFLRLIFEKTGGSVEGYKFQAQEEKLYEFISTIEYWDTENPIICELFIWILPNKKGKNLIEKITGKKFRENDYSWWDTHIDLGEGITPTTTNDYPEQYGYIPNDLVDKWARYLPTIVWNTTMLLYQNITRNNNFDLSYNSIELLLENIRQVMQKLGLKDKEKDTTSIDREFLVKELFDINSIIYPTNELSMLECLQQLGFVLNHELNYSLTKKLPEPKKTLKIPKEWESKMDKFVGTGSILFSYLNTDEILRGLE